MRARAAALGLLVLLATMTSWGLPQLMRPPDRFDVAMHLIETGRANDAVHLLDDPAWQGVAEYRAGRFRRALNAFFAEETVVTLYNTGNAYAHLHEWGGAAAAYERVLHLDPTHADARHNLDVVRRAEEAERALLAEARGERQIGRWRDGNREAPESGPDGDHVEDGTAQDGDLRPATTPVARGGQSDRAGTLGDRARSEDARGGVARAAATDGPEIEGLSGTSAALVRRESAQAAEILLREIRDDPARVLRARFRAAHRQRLRGEAACASC